MVWECCEILSSRLRGSLRSFGALPDGCSFAFRSALNCGSLLTAKSSPMTMVRVLSVFPAILWVCLTCEAQEWTRFRGPNGLGESDTPFPATWEDDDYSWQAEFPGIGHSSPVIWGKRLFIQSADEQGTQWLVCLDTETGRQLWAKDFASQPYHIHARNSFASSTPAVDESSVYFAFATPDQITLMAVSHDGEPRWKRDDLGPFASQHGFATSPVVCGEFLVLSNLQMPLDGDDSKSSVIAFHKTTGKIAWKRPRVSGKASYSVPCLRESPEGKELLLCSTTHGMFGLDLATGKEKWAVKDAFSMRTVSSPLLVGDLVFGSTGSGAGGNYVVAIDLEKQEVKYKVDQQAPYVPTPVAHGDLVFLWYDKGVVRCIDAHSNETHWRERVGGNYSGSPIRAGDKIYCISEDGHVVVLAASKDFRVLGKTQLGEDSRGTPAVADGKMFLRTYSKLFCLKSS